MSKLLTPEERQKPFKIDMTMVTSEMLGGYILGKLETTWAWVMPVYEDGGTFEEDVAQLAKALQPDPDLREWLAIYFYKGTFPSQRHYEMRPWEIEPEETRKIFYADADVVLSHIGDIKRQERERIIKAIEGEFIWGQVKVLDTEIGDTEWTMRCLKDEWWQALKDGEE